MNKEQLMYINIMFEEVDMNVKNKEDVDVKVEHVDCSDACNTFLCICLICCWYNNYIT